MEDFIYCEESLILNEEKMLSSTIDQSLSSTRCQINFILSCKPKYFVLHQHSSTPELQTSFDPPLINNFIQVTLGDLVSNEPAKKAIEESLKDWPVRDRYRKAFTKYILKKARHEFLNMPSLHNCICLGFKVTSKHVHIFDEGRALNSTIQQSMDEAKSCMVPATASSIESLEKIRLMDCGTSRCSICLEDFSADDGDREGACLPSCKHIFHEDCIRKWLGTSHYCPICRFEMPTS